MIALATTNAFKKQESHGFNRRKPVHGQGKSKVRLDAGQLIAEEESRCRGKTDRAWLTGPCGQVARPDQPIEIKVESFCWFLMKNSRAGPCCTRSGRRARGGIEKQEAARPPAEPTPGARMGEAMEKITPPSKMIVARTPLRRRSMGVAFGLSGPDSYRNK